MGIDFCEDCSKEVDRDGAHVELVDKDGKFFLHVQCFLDGDWMRDDDVVGRGIAESALNVN